MTRSIKTKLVYDRKFRLRLPQSATPFTPCWAVGVANMVRLAVLSKASRFHQPVALIRQYDRATMRTYALWARVFAGHLGADAKQVVAAEETARHLARQIRKPIQDLMTVPPCRE